MKKKILLGIAALALVVGVAVYASSRPEPADTRFSGAYALADGTLVFVTPREGPVLRYRQMNGESAVLWPIGEGEYEGGAGWDQREPVINNFKFASGAQRGFEWRRADDKVVQGRRLDLPERTEKFPSGDLQLRGKLVLPNASTHGAGPYPAVIIVHGSESYSAVDHYYEPYMYAANGFAALAFDKRGTGQSQGEYLQNFHVLSDDVVAAIRWM
ncbi:MAG TPA: CocE/NonD family hydrolase, partial [Steroidobacteraceae bacterium]|nr:CocE/NonD family hydrolase [Steroidobacteraceae bacterium]